MMTVEMLLLNYLNVRANKKIILGHLSNTNNQPDLAYQTVLNVLNENGIKQNQDIILTMANRHNPSSYIEI